MTHARSLALTTDLLLANARHEELSLETRFSLEMTRALVGRVLEGRLETDHATLYAEVYEEVYDKVYRRAA